MKTSDFKYILNLFNWEGPQDPIFIENILDHIELAHDAKGSKHYDASSYIDVTGGAGATFINWPATGVPSGKLWWIALASGYHNDAAARDLRIGCNHATFVCAAQALSLNSGEHVVLPKRIVIPGSGQIRLEADAMGGAAQLVLRVQYFEIDPGDYSLPF